MSSAVAVSVVIPCYNAQNYLQGAVSSVLAQSEVSSEVIIVDDHSTDDSAALAEELAGKNERVKALHRRRNGGAGAARNDGLRAAIGRYVSFLDADDEHAPGFLATGVEILDADPKLAMVGTGIELINSHRPVHPVQMAAIEDSAPSNIVIRRKIAELVGGFPESPEFRGKSAGEDITFRLAIKKWFKSAKVQKPLLRGRVRRGGHFDFFLDRSHVENGRLVFTSKAPEEEDGTISAAREYYFRQVQERIEASQRAGTMTIGSPLAAPSHHVAKDPPKLIEHRQEVNRVNGRATPHSEAALAEHIRKGCAFANKGAIEEAVAEYRLALALKSDCFEAHFHLGNALSVRGKNSLAVDSLRCAIALRPDHVEAHNALGLAQAKRGQLTDAVAAFRQAIRFDSQFVKAHLNLGVALAELRKLDEAVASFQQSLEIKADYYEAHFNLGNVLCDLGKKSEAVEHYELALQLKPDHVEALNNLGVVLTELNRMGAAAVHLRQAVRIKPDHFEAWNNLGLAVSGQGRFEEAIGCYEKTLAHNPRHIDALNNLGSAYRDLGRLEEAIACYQHAIWLQPDNASCHWNRSLALLHLGDFERGLPEYEWRWKRKNATLPPYAQPRWDGSPLPDGTILIYVEQGLGDMIQFIRFAPFVRQRVARVIVACPERMRKLFSTQAGIDGFVHEGETLPHFDVQAPLMSLPYLLGTRLKTIPWNTPYLRADPQRVQKWSTRLGGSNRYKIGIAWQGNPRHRLDRHRSIPLLSFAHLASVPNVQLFSLQLGAGSEALKSTPAVPVTEVFDLPNDPGIDFADTAAAIYHLDLVVCADTAVAHLAGALAKPVWVGLAAVTDWRWLQGRSDTPWYPTMRLFRQTKLDDWDTVFIRMAEALRNGLKNDSNGQWDDCFLAPRIDK